MFKFSRRTPILSCLLATAFAISGCGGAEGEAADQLAELESCLTESFPEVKTAPLADDETLPPEERRTLLAQEGPGFVNIVEGSLEDPTLLLYVFEGEPGARAFHEAVDAGDTGLEEFGGQSSVSGYPGSELLGNRVLVTSADINDQGQVDALKRCGVNPRLSTGSAITD